MAFLKKDKSGNYLVGFVYGGKEFTRSLKTKSLSLADHGVARVEETLMRLASGWLPMPSEGDPGLFIVSGGQLSAKPMVESQKSTVVPTVKSVLDLYESTLTTDSKAASSLATEQIHLRHITKFFGEAAPFSSILTTPSAQSYVDGRAKEARQSQTIKKELATLGFVANWARRRNHIEQSETFNVKHLTFPKSKSKEPFKTWEEIVSIISTENPNQARTKTLWESLYLSEDQVNECLGYVKENAKHPFIYPMFALCAYTGARRGEVLRSEKKDVKFKDNVILIRGTKANKSTDFTIRHVPIHPNLKAILTDWFEGDHPGGSWMICTEDGHRIGERMGTKYFRQAVSGSKWQHLHGFHVFRHTMASIMASKGKDQRIINAILGHSTEDMEKRYRHLFPQATHAGISDLFS